MDLTKELIIAEELARIAGHMALAMRDELVVNHKPNGEGPVTNADIAIDNFIVDELRKKFPNDNIISEESYRGRDEHIIAGRTWLIDPIDGTASYILGHDDFVIMIGLAIDGIARLGVIFQPAKKILWRGVALDDKHEATRQEGQQQSILNSTTPYLRPDLLTIIASHYHRTPKQTEMLKRLKPAQIIYKSSIGLKAMMITEKRADLYVAWSKRIKMWDTCAPTAILTGASLHVSFLDGKSLNFSGSLEHGRSVIFANFHPNEIMLEELNAIAYKSY